jgi:hypothetical protein
MGNAQTSVCFRAAWKTGVDTNERRRLKNLNNIMAVDIDGNSKTIGDYMKGKKCLLIVNVASA